MMEKESSSKQFTVVRLQEDTRGAVDEITLNGKQFHLIFTKPGVKRGGDFHPSTSYCTMLAGSGVWHIREDGQVHTKQQNANEALTIASNVPHYFETMESEALMIEWMEQEGPFVSIKDEEFRAIVIEAMRKR